MPPWGQVVIEGLSEEVKFKWRPERSCGYVGQEASRPRGHDVQRPEEGFLFEEQQVSQYSWSSIIRNKIQEIIQGQSQHIIPGYGGRIWGLILTLMGSHWKVWARFSLSLSCDSDSSSAIDLSVWTWVRSWSLSLLLGKMWIITLIVKWH